MSELLLDNIALERGERRIASGISAKVAEGQALLLHGPNGSGKSTLLRVLAGLLPAAEGSLWWSGQDVTEDRDGFRARFHYLGHQDALKPGMTALENLQFWARYGGGDAKAAFASLRSGGAGGPAGAGVVGGPETAGRAEPPCLAAGPALAAR